MQLTGPCEWMAEKCGRTGRLYEYRNALGESTRHHFCRLHARAMNNPEQRAEMLHRVTAAMEAAPSVLSPQELAEHDVQKALSEHQDHCQRCGAVRDWIRSEMMAGRLRNKVDTIRVGERVVSDCCPIGVYLNERLGQVMTGWVK